MKADEGRARRTPSAADERRPRVTRSSGNLVVPTEPSKFELKTKELQFKFSKLNVHNTQRTHIRVVDVFGRRPEAKAALSYREAQP
ncbi:hypothetical protein EVAR_81497_1 [Eumeta japonica]|uniref:Uncharacterized protein n=1 Tax=Eumeta variegata TaxID=151549 RepID=A0A4C1W2M1_EUMVA|nr:hypothetical protein EVAR_81497_1 [Eumeta japonica]